MISNFLGNRFGLFPTTRLMDGLKIYSFMVLLGLVGFVFIPFYESNIETQVIKIFNVSKINVESSQIYIVYIISSMLIVVMLKWTIRNQLSFKNYVIHFRIRQAMNRSHFSLNNKETTEFESKRYTPPKTRIKWNDKDKKTGRLFIRNRSDIEKGLERINLSSEIVGYNVETAYLTDDNHWVVYELYSFESAKKRVFPSQHEFNNWATQVRKYELRLDERTTQELKHTVIIGATRSGKTYSLMSLLFQMKLKPITYHLYFIDPKNSDGGTIGNAFSSEHTVVDDGNGNFTENVLSLVDVFYKKMIERQSELNQLTNGKVSTDYRAYDLEPYFLIIDELPSLVASLDKKEEKKFLDLIGNISRLGAGSGYFLVVLAQRLDSTTLPKQIQANMLNKIILGNADNQTYLTSIDRVEDVPKKKFGKGEGIFKDDTMSKPLMVNFPYLKYLDEIETLQEIL